MTAPYDPTARGNARNQKNIADGYDLLDDLSAWLVNANGVILQLGKTAFAARVELAMKVLNGDTAGLLNIEGLDATTQQVIGELVSGRYDGSAVLTAFDAASNSNPVPAPAPGQPTNPQDPTQLDPEIGRFINELLTRMSQLNAASTTLREDMPKTDDEVGRLQKLEKVKGWMRQAGNLAAATAMLENGIRAFGQHIGAVQPNQVFNFGSPAPSQTSSHSLGS